MKDKSLAIVFVFLIIVISIISVSALDKKPGVLCKEKCSFDKKQNYTLCNTNYRYCADECSDKECRNNCNVIKRNCIDKNNFVFQNCPKNCRYAEKNITCGNHSLGEVFYDNCQICRCEYDGRINCKNMAYCGYDVFVKKSECNGLYQQLCNGPYFDIVCSKEYFCLCDGLKNYSCPEDYSCVHNISVSSVRKGHTIMGWKTLLGEELGDVGICAKNIA